MGTKKELSCVRPDHTLPFPDLPAYKPHSAGLLSYVPLSCLPYAELARIDKPGFVAIWMIHLFGIIQAGIVMQAPLSEVLYLVAYFIPACEFFMSFNFAWNDTCDFQYDSKVARTRHRPLVRGAVSLPAALAFDCVLVAITALFLIPLPRACTVFAIPIGIGCLIYPLSKRWTNFPQLVLAVISPGGVFMGAAAVGAMLIPDTLGPAEILDWEIWVTTQRTQAQTFLYSYLTVAVWTLHFEIIYSFQDAKWDEAAGVGTITRLLKGYNGGTAKAFLLILAIIQTLLYAQAGNLVQACSVYWPFSVALTFITLVVQIYFVDLENEDSCMFWFAMGNMLTGSAMLIGSTSEYYVQVLEYELKIF